MGQHPARVQLPVQAVKEDHGRQQDGPEDRNTQKSPRAASAASPPVAMLEWASRYVLSWRLSNTLDAEFCVDALEMALAHGRPEIFNSDQGSQFTSKGFTDLLLDADVRISENGKGRCMGNRSTNGPWQPVVRGRGWRPEVMEVMGMEDIMEKRQPRAPRWSEARA